MMRDVRNLYESQEIPEELSHRVELAIEQGKRKKRRLGFSRWAASLAAACLLLVASVNVNPELAKAMGEIPVLGSFFRLVTFEEYQEESHAYVADVRVPHVDTSSLVGDVSWAEDINKTITEQIDREVEDSMSRAEEYYDAYVATGGVPEEFHPVLIEVDYELKCAREDFVSFMIYKFETLASAYQQNFYYNIDLKTGESVTLSDLMGENWVEEVTAQVEEQLLAFPQESRDMLFLDYLDLETVVREDAGFYLTDDGSIVVTFPKYSLGAGALGILEFPVTH